MRVVKECFADGCDPCLLGLNDIQAVQLLLGHNDVAPDGVRHINGDVNKYRRSLRDLEVHWSLQLSSSFRPPRIRCRVTGIYSPANVLHATGLCQKHF